MKSAGNLSKGTIISGLRTGKIYSSKSSASEIRLSVGVKPSEAKVASNALRIARSATTGKLVPAAKARPRPAARGTKSKKG